MSSKKNAAKKTIKSVLPKATPKSTVVSFEKLKRNDINPPAHKTENKMQNNAQVTMQNAAEQIEKAASQFTTRLEEAADFNRSNLDAAVQAANTVAEGIKDVNEAIFGHIQQSLQAAMSTGKAMMGVKSLRDLMELQTQFVKSSFDCIMADTTKISEIAVRCSNEAAQPINARVSDVVEKVSKAAKKAA